MKKIIFVLLIYVLPLWADGLLVPVDERYPKDFLRNRLTRVDVTFHGPLAETSVYQEFINEWHEPVDAVYSFPLPFDARAVNFLYWRNDSTFQAVLRVREQAVNPGTGEGGIIAKVNKYIGSNGLRIKLLNIAPGTLQKVQLFYISHCEYYNGQHRYTYPLETADFVKHPLDHLQFTFRINSSSPVIDYDIPDFDYNVLTTDDSEAQLAVSMNKSKAFLNRDLLFWFKTRQDQLGIDFFSVANDSTDGHFVLYVRPQNEAGDDQVLSKRIIFVLSTSSMMSGYRLSAAVKAIGTSLDLLNDKDYFNIISYSSVYKRWQDAPMLATPKNVTSAKEFLDNAAPGGGSNMADAIKSALVQINDNKYFNAIVTFADGWSSLDPEEIEALNHYNCGIFPIGIGDDLNYARLELLAGLNYGFVTYFDDDDNLLTGMEEVISQISRPILKDVIMEYGLVKPTQLLPKKIPATCAGRYFFTTGRYQSTGESSLTLGGQSIAGPAVYAFRLNYSTSTEGNKFVESVWAKEKIDELERKIFIYGETSASRDSLIDLSLTYNIRCRYTAYVADYKNEYTSVNTDRKTISIPRSYIVGNYPNPFNPATTIKVVLGPGSEKIKVKLLRIYNALGQLVAVFDLSFLGAGEHLILFNGVDYAGRVLPSGVYIAQLQVGQE
ncbi:VWA domain-containing protein, partial [candidate division KSB1 bacterium]